MKVKVIGAGLAGSEAAWQLANRGIEVELSEMKPQKMTPAHHSAEFAELVCSNSLRGDRLENAVGLLKEELRRCGSLILACADAACTKPVSGSPFTTGADGSVTVSDLSVGTLYAKEIEVDDPYWVCDTSVKTVNITAGQTATVSFCNMQYGKIQIQKAMETVGSLTGWQFRITDSSGTEIPGSPFSTDETGLILSEKLQPGEYKVEELIPENSLYSCTSENPQTVTVKAGETAGVSFTNALRPGRILIEKVDIRGEPLADAKFLLEWSKDGSLWWPVEYTDAETVREGFCFNAKCVNGTLTSGKDGLLEWTGLHPGLMYRVTELEAPKGYSLLTEPAFEGTLPADNLTVSFHVVNCEIFKLPDTGMTSGAWLRVSQFACIFLCTALLVYSYRKERRQ